ncbi:MAG: radical SAM protein, partial [Candidatus Omnitrophota bacterium]
INPMDVDLANYIDGRATSSPHIIIKDGDSLNAPFSPEKGKTKKVSIGIPRHEAFINKKYRVPFMKAFLYTTVSTQFGCPFSCSYCSASRIPVVYRPYEEVIKELIYIDRLGIHELFFSDPSFGFPKDNARHLLQWMVKEKFRFSWSCYCNPQLVDENTLKLMKQAGCHTVIIGIEDDDFAMLGAKFERKMTKDYLASFLNNCRRHKIRVCGDFIIGLNDREGAVTRMVEFAIKCRLDFASFNIYVPLMGSVERQRLIERGLVDSSSIGYDTFGTTGKEEERLLSLRNRAVRSFYMRPSYLFKRFVEVTNFAEFIIQWTEMIGLIKGCFAKRKVRGN